MYVSLYVCMHMSEVPMEAKREHWIAPELGNKLRVYGEQQVLLTAEP